MRKMMKPENKSATRPEAPNGFQWRRSAISTVGAVAFALLMEWAFQGTKPSFLSGETFLSQLFIFVSAVGPLTLFLLLPVGALYGVSRALGDYGPARARAIPGWIASALPSTILAVTFLLMVDNFTKSALGFGVVDSRSASRYLYVIGILAVVIVLTVRFRSKMVAPGLTSGAKTLSGSGFIPVASLLGLSLLLALTAATVGSLRATPDSRASKVGQTGKSARPNILILGSDGITASRMSVYGYRYDTTPFLRKSFAKSAVVFDNFYTNAGNSGGSITAMLTGKLPTTTRVIYPPDILKGADAYQSLPAILRRLGYRNFDVGITHYADPPELNMRDAFDFSNGRDYRGSSTPFAWLSGVLGSGFVSQGYLIEQLIDRSSERILHITGIRPMEDTFALVVGKRALGWNESDGARLRGLFRFIDETHGQNKPFFAHVHLMGSHGPKFKPFHRVRSETPEGETVEHYDDAILDFDYYVKQVVESLRARGLEEDTMLIVTSDHAEGWGTRDPIPLLVHYPGQKIGSRAGGYAQNIDIAPTVLELLRVPAPSWMEGISLRDLPSDQARQVISVKSDDKERESKGGGFFASTAGPPFYSMGWVKVSACGEQYVMRLPDGKLYVLKDEELRSDCAPSRKLGLERAGKLLIEHLRVRGWDVSGLKAKY